MFKKKIMGYVSGYQSAARWYIKCRVELVIKQITAMDFIKFEFNDNLLNTIKNNSERRLSKH